MMMRARLRSLSKSRAYFSSFRAPVRKYDRQLLRGIAASCGLYGSPTPQPAFWPQPWPGRDISFYQKRLIGVIIMLADIDVGTTRGDMRRRFNTFTISLMAMFIRLSRGARRHISKRRASSDGLRRTRGAAARAY